MLEYFHPSTQLGLLPHYQRELEFYHDCTNIKGRWQLFTRMKGIPLSSGEYFFILAETGHLHAVGDMRGQLGLESMKYCSKWAPVPTPETVVAVVTSHCHTFILTENGYLYVTGHDYFGHLGLVLDGEEIWRQWTLVPTPEPVVTIVTNDDHSFFLTRSGLLYATGRNGYGQLGLGDRKDRCEWTFTPTPENVVAIAMSDNYTFIITGDGRLYATGDNEDGQLGLGDKKARLKWTLVPTPEPVVAIAAGWDHSLLLTKSGRLYATGSNSCGQLGSGDGENHREWTLVPAPGTVVTIIAAGNHSLLLNDSGELYASYSIFFTVPEK